MKLTVKERLVLGKLYPQKASLTEQIIVREISNKVKLTSKDYDDFDIKENGNQYFWNKKQDTNREINFNDAEINLLKELVEQKSNAKEISQDMLDLCIKIKTAKTKETK